MWTDIQIKLDYFIPEKIQFKTIPFVALSNTHIQLRF